MIRSKWLIIILSAAAVALAACSGSDDVSVVPTSSFSQEYTEVAFATDANTHINTVLARELGVGSKFGQFELVFEGPTCRTPVWTVCVMPGEKEGADNFISYHEDPDEWNSRREIQQPWVPIRLAEVRFFGHYQWSADSEVNRDVSLVCAVGFLYEQVRAEGLPLPVMTERLLSQIRGVTPNYSFSEFERGMHASALSTC